MENLGKGKLKLNYQCHQLSCFFSQKLVKLEPLSNNDYNYTVNFFLSKFDVENIKFTLDCPKKCYGSFSSSLDTSYHSPFFLVTKLITCIIFDLAIIHHGILICKVCSST
jgi:hypothetical protein